MSQIISYSEVEEKILNIKGQNVILDRDVAELYGVETKRINEAVKNNPEKFLRDYTIDVDLEELDNLRSKISTANVSQKTGEIWAEVLDDNALEVSNDETTIELNLAIMKIKHTVRRNKRNNTDVVK